MTSSESTLSWIPVLGMHRSGTSALTRSLLTLGVDLGGHLMEPMPEINAKGFWEDMDIYQLDEEMLRAVDTHRRVGVLSRPIRASMRDRPCAADQIIGPGRPGHRRTVTPSLGRRRYTRLPTDWTATMRHSTRLLSQLTRSLRRMQFAALPPGDYSPPLRSPGSQRTLQAVRQQHVDALSFAYYLPNL